jgi:hypothetical protein
LHLLYPAPQGSAGAIAGSQVGAPAFYGADFASYPPGATADSLMQQLFENTPLGILGFYLAPAPWHTNRNWQ